MSVTVRAGTPDTAEPAPTPPVESCTVIIFGATGDLTRRKLLPALYGLRCFGSLGSRCEIIGTGRTPQSGKEFRARMRGAAAASQDGKLGNDPRWPEFEERLRYLAGNPGDPAFYPRLASELEARRQDGASPNYLFYIATPASLARPIIEGLGAAGLARNSHGWSRIVLEKPFGHNRIRSGRRTLAMSVWSACAARIPCLASWRREPATEKSR